MNIAPSAFRIPQSGLIKTPPASFRVPESGLILLDCDEVLLCWHAAFLPWANKVKGLRMQGPRPLAHNLAGWLPADAEAQAMALIQEFNATPQSGFGNLQALDGAADFLRIARENGYRCRIITACSLDPGIHAVRRDNLERAFGKDAFDDISFVDLGASKQAELARHPESLWFDDMPGHVRAGNGLGHIGYVVSSSHNWAQQRSAEFEDLRWINGLGDMIPLMQPAPTFGQPAP